MRPDCTGGEPLLLVEGLNVEFNSARSRIHAVRGVNLTIGRGECVAILGQSGSGKSVTARSLLGLAGRTAVVSTTKFTFDGADLSGIDQRQWRQIRGRRIGLILQDALTALDPLRRIGDEIREPLTIHRLPERLDAPAEIIRLLKDVGVPDPELRCRQYPHELSGGLRQRALIASALAAQPALIVADEPTTALDVAVQAQILDLLAAKRDEGTALLLISHDLGVVGQIADRILVMHRGVIIEQGPAAQILTTPNHPHTRELIAATVRLAAGRPPSPSTQNSAELLLEVDKVSKQFVTTTLAQVTAVDQVSLQVRAGETLGIVGESGSGKSSLASIILGLLEPDQGAVRFLGRPWSGTSERIRRPLRPQIQPIPQDPLSSFDPRYTVERVVGEALGQGAQPSIQVRRSHIRELLREVGLDDHLIHRRPRDLSGGQRQRVAIARALALRPQLLVCDEPVSALDVLSQALILDLLNTLRETHGLAVVLISHNLAVVSQVCDRVIVMKDGAAVETGKVCTVFAQPRHPYTRSLLACLPKVLVAATSATRSTRPSSPAHLGEGRSGAR